MFVKQKGIHCNIVKIILGQEYTLIFVVLLLKLVA